ncbi:MAG: DUF131 domain-containing protein [Methanomassiliicoccales archaeon]|nr:DUF131 domain-containing protein [Methanomassiliicoccales archaeon]
MTRLRLVALLLLLVGAVGIVSGILAGEIQVGLLFFVIPYLYGGTALGALSILAVVIGVVLLFVDAARRSVPEVSSPAPLVDGEPSRKTKWGGVVIVGPIPIIFGSTPRLALVALVIAAAILTALLLLFLFVR